MLDKSKDTLVLPPYKSVKHLEGKGNFAVKKYYQFPFSYFYKHKLRMALQLMGKGYYSNILDYGTGAKIFVPTLRKYATHVVPIQDYTVMNPRWKFELIVCASVLEFVDNLDTVLSILRNTLSVTGELIVVSPMTTKFTDLYFSLIKDNSIRHDHEFLIKKISDNFSVDKIIYWNNLYFGIRATR